MNQSSQEIQACMPLAFIQARWHADIVDQARLPFAAEMACLSAGRARIEVIDVPGAFEIPLQAKRLASSGQYAAIVAAAFVVDGGIYRHDFVASAVVSGLMQVQLETDVPVFSLVLTPHHFHETAEHRSFFHEHFKVKGREAAQACLTVFSLPKQVRAVA